jgi:N-ethylmaleimide reductase
MTGRRKWRADRHHNRVAAHPADFNPPNPMTTLFDPCVAGDLHLANRIVMAPLTRNRSPHAVPTDLAVTYYRQRASAGLLIAEATAISHQGQGYADVPGLYAPDQLQAWYRVTDAVHAAGGRIVVQLWHVGRVSHNELQPGGGAPVAPSAITAKTKTVLIRDGVPTFVETSAPRALDSAEIPGIVDDYRRAAAAAVRQAGFDGVEIHAANGYLIDQFLKTGANHRTDAYGGSIPNRARLLIEVTRAVAQAAGAGRTGIRLAPVTPANDIVDADPQPLFEYVARQLAPLGLAYIHVIEGATGGARELPDRPFDYLAFKAAYRSAGGRGAWMVNNGYDLVLAEQALAAGADLVAFGKPFIANPDLVRRLRERTALNTPDRSTFFGGGAKGYIDYPALPA